MSLPAAALEDVVHAVAENRVIARAAVGVVDQRGGFVRIVRIDLRVGDVAAGKVFLSCDGIKAEIGALEMVGARVEDGPAAGRKIDAEIGGIVRKIVGIVAAAVPHRHKDLAVRRRDFAIAVDLADAVDELLTGDRIPRIRRISAVVVVVGAVHVLQRGNVILHVGGRMIRRAVKTRGGVVRKLLISHHRVFIKFVVRRQRRKCDAMPALRHVPVLEAHRVPQLMHDAGRILETPDRRVVVAARVEPHVALGIGGRKRWSRAEGSSWRIPFGSIDIMEAGVLRDCAVVGVIDRTCLGEAQLRAAIR